MPEDRPDNKKPEEKAYTLRMPKPLWRELRRLAADRDATVKDVIIEALGKTISDPGREQDRRALA